MSRTPLDLLHVCTVLSGTETSALHLFGPVREEVHPWIVTSKSMARPKVSQKSRDKTAAADFTQ